MLLSEAKETLKKNGYKLVEEYEEDWCFLFDRKMMRKYDIDEQDILELSVNFHANIEPDKKYLRIEDMPASEALKFKSMIKRMPKIYSCLVSAQPM